MSEPWQDGRTKVKFVQNGAEVPHCSRVLSVYVTAGQNVAVSEVPIVCLSCMVDAWENADRESQVLTCRRQPNIDAAQVVANGQHQHPVL